MLIKLTESGLKVMGFGADRSIINVHNDRAYHLMAQGHCNQDRSFMARYEYNNPVEPKTKPKPKPKKEKATSKKAASRETATQK